MPVVSGLRIDPLVVWSGLGLEAHAGSNSPILLITFEILKMEYFVTYLDIKPPHCWTIETTHSEVDALNRRTGCHKYTRLGKNEPEYKEDEKFLFFCDTEPCPQLPQAEASCRCSIGELDSDEYNLFREVTEIWDKPDFELRSEVELGLSPCLDIRVSFITDSVVQCWYCVNCVVLCKMLRSRRSIL